MSSGQVILMRVKTLSMIFKLHGVDTIAGDAFGLLYTTPLWIKTEQPIREESTSQHQCLSWTDPYGTFWQQSYNSPWCANLILSLLANQNTDLIMSLEMQDEFCVVPRNGLIMALAGAGFVGLDENRCDKKSCLFSWSRGQVMVTAKLYEFCLGLNMARFLH